MSMPPMNSPNSSADKFDTHYRQQLSALMDGELAADESRFLLRRLQHDEELNAQWERWQLLGDALRGRVEAPAPDGFAQRIGAAIAAEPASAVTSRNAGNSSRSGLLRWGGGALAASVAALALFVSVRPAAEDASPSPAPVAVAPTPTSVALPSAETVAVPQTSLADADEVAPAPAVAATTRLMGTPRNSGAGQRTRAAAARTVAPTRAVAETPVLVASQVPAGTQAEDPFSSAGREAQQHVPAARPWPRSVLRGYPSSGAFTASFGGAGARDFYPFEPRLPQAPPIEAPAEAEPQD